MVLDKQIKEFHRFTLLLLDERPVDWNFWREAVAAPRRCYHFNN